MASPIIIAIDGPAASGKGTLAKQLAQKLNLVHLDTGKIYRAVGKQLMEQGYSADYIKDMGVFTEEGLKLAASLTLDDLRRDDLDDEGVGNMASIVGSIPELREALLDFQRDIATNPEGAVLDGRDIGTVVCPDATVKFYVTASLETRATRRYKQLQSNNNNVTYTDILQNLQARDARDSSRASAPLVVAQDAIRMDTTTLSLDDMVSQALEIIQSRTSGS